MPIDWEDEEEPEDFENEEEDWPVDDF